MDLIQLLLVIDDHLLCKLSLEEVDTEVSVAACSERKIICHVTTECPRVLKDMLVVCTHEFLSSREHTDIVYKRSRISEAATSVCPDYNLVDRHILDCESWRHTELLFSHMVEQVTAKSGNYRHFFTKVICIFSEHSCIGKIGHALVCNVLEHNDTAEILIVSVECSVETHCKPVRVVDHILIQEISESRMLTCKIRSLSEIGIHILIVIVCDQGDILRIVLIQRNSHLKIAVE